MKKLPINSFIPTRQEKGGDLGYVDINGAFTVLNRKKAVIVRPMVIMYFPQKSVLLKYIKQ